MDDAVTICKYAPNAVDVLWGQITSRGPLDLEDRQEQDESGLLVRVRVMILRVPTTHLDGIARSDVVTVTKRGIQTVYRVREVELADDGDLMELTLARST